MKNLLINRLIVSLIEPPLKRFLILFCLVAEDLYMLVMCPRAIVSLLLLSYFNNKDVFSLSSYISNLVI